MLLNTCNFAFVYKTSHCVQRMTFTWCPSPLMLFCFPYQEFLGQYSISTYWNINQTSSTKLNSIISINIFQIRPLKISIFFLYFFFVFTQCYSLLHFIWTVCICHLFLHDFSSLYYRDCYKFVLNRKPVDSEVNSNTIMPRQSINI